MNAHKLIILRHLLSILHYQIGMMRSVIGNAIKNPENPHFLSQTGAKQLVLTNALNPITPRQRLSILLSQIGTIQLVIGNAIKLSAVHLLLSQTGAQQPVHTNA